MNHWASDIGGGGIQDDVFFGTRSCIVCTLGLLSSFCISLHFCHELLREVLYEMHVCHYMGRICKSVSGQGE